MPDKFYITTPIYYVNAKPHIGSAYTTIAADVLARWHRQQGSDVFFLTGTAEHGAKMAQAADAAGLSPQDFVDQQSAQFSLAWDHLGIAPDNFIRTSEPRHAQAVEKFFLKLKDSGQIYEGEYEGLYCVGHEAFLKESELDAEGLCPDHKTAPEKIKENNWFFKLSDYTDTLRQLIGSGQLTIEPASRRNEILSFIEQGLEDISISRQNVEWALPLPWDASQTIYVWLDELFNYCSAIGYGADDDTFRRYWPADVHLVGKDIIKFHCIIWPALLLAIGEAVPRKVFAHGFFTVNGQKIGKSLGNAIDPMNLANEYGADAVRYVLLRDIPFGQDGDFSLERFHSRYQSDLANGLGNLASRVLKMIEKYQPQLDRSAAAPSAVTAQLTQAATTTADLAFDRALSQIWQAVAWADALIEKKKPWELAKAGESDTLAATLQQLYTALVAINESLYPYLPATHAALAQLLAADPLVKPKQPLFPRIDKK